MRTIIDTFISEYPVCQYEVIDTSELIFSEKVRQICKNECERYGKSWSCPPAVGEVAVCKSRALGYEKALLFTTLAEVTDTAIWTETLATRQGHEEVTRALCGHLRAHGFDVLPLSSESCQICETCAYPAPCRHPEYAIPCVESYGILVTDIAEKYGIDFYSDVHTVTWFGIILLRRK